MQVIPASMHLYMLDVRMLLHSPHDVFVHALLAHGNARYYAALSESSQRTKADQTLIFVQQHTPGSTAYAQGWPR